MICQLIVCDRLTDGTFSEERKVRLEIDANVGSVEFQVKLDQKVQFGRDSQRQKYNRLRCLLVLVICFYLHWSGNTLPIRTNIIKVGSKSWLLTCSSNITFSLPSYIILVLIGRESYIFITAILRRGHVSCFSGHSHNAFAMFIL